MSHIRDCRGSVRRWRGVCRRLRAPWIGSTSRCQVINHFHIRVFSRRLPVTDDNTGHLQCSGVLRHLSYTTTSASCNATIPGIDYCSIPCVNSQEFKRHLNYTVGHKKRATLFGIITPKFCGGFLHFLHQWKQEKYSIGNYKICSFTIIVSTLPEKI